VCKEVSKLLDTKHLDSKAITDAMIHATGSSHWNRILDKINQIAASIQATEEWKRFKQAEEKIEHHDDAQSLLSVVKAKRNKYSQVSLRLGYEHPEAVQAKKEYDEVLEKIAQIPLIEQYQAYQEDLNELIQGVLATILASLSETIPVEQGEATHTGGCGTGGCGGSCGNH
jgi:cell fate (sporulation/competence/biofilm development) regulator YmcA (YheA/YmcA/DUF963 family)